MTGQGEGVYTHETKYSYTRYYKLFKQIFVGLLENYLISTPSFNLSKEFTKVRTNLGNIHNNVGIK
jgi:hypothetical protein